MDQLDQMFHDVAVDGSTSFVTGESVTVDEEEEEEVAEDPDVHTLVSITSHKRASRTSTTSSSPRKQPKSPIVRTMNKYISENAKIQAQRNEYFKQHLAAKQQKEAAKYDKIMHVQQLARECGVEETNRPMWFAVHRMQ